MAVRVKGECDRKAIGPEIGLYACSSHWQHLGRGRLQALLADEVQHCQLHLRKDLTILVGQNSPAAQDIDGKSLLREGVTVDHLVLQLHSPANNFYLVLVELLQWLYHHSSLDKSLDTDIFLRIILYDVAFLQIVWQETVGIQGVESYQPFVGIQIQLVHHLVLDVEEIGMLQLSLSIGIHFLSHDLQEAAGGICHHKVLEAKFLISAGDVPALILAEKTVVDVDSQDTILSQCLVQQGKGHIGIHSTR